MAIIFPNPILTANGAIGTNDFVVSSNSVTTGYEPWHAFSIKTDDAYSSAVNPETQAVTFDMYSAYAIILHGITFVNAPSPLTSSSPAQFSVMASTDGTQYISLGNFTNGNNVNGSEWSISISNTTGYKYYRLNITSATTSNAYVNIGKIKLDADYVLGANNLPVGYTALEYIQTSGTQYINTGYKPNQDTRVIYDCNVVSSFSSNDGIFGVRDTSAATSPNRFNFWMQGNGSTIRSDYFGDGTNPSQSINLLNQRIVIDKNKNVCTVAGNTLTSTAGTGQCESNLFLFCVNSAGTPNYFTNTRLYSCQIYDNDILVRDFLPCTDANGIIGLFDLVSGVLYKNGGTGNFIAGPAKAGPTISGVPADAGLVGGSYNFNYTVTTEDGAQAITIRELIDGNIVKEYTSASGVQQIYILNIAGLASGDHTFGVQAVYNYGVSTSTGNFEVPNNIVTVRQLRDDYGSRRRTFLVKYYINDTANSASFQVTEKIDNTTIRTFTAIPSEVYTIVIDPDNWDEGNHTIQITAIASEGGSTIKTAYFFVDKDRYAYMRRTQRNLRAKINLLNFDFQIVDEISGEVTDGSISVDANSDIRRTCSIVMVAVDSKYNIQPGSRVWLDKMIQIFIGVDDSNMDSVEWINMGIYIIDTPTFMFDAANRTLTFQGLDLMAKMTGQRNGYLEGIPTVIPQGSSIRESMIATVTQLGGFTRYVIEENPQPVPYDIQVDPGGTVYDILRQLRDILPSWQIYFDIDGVFHYDQIPTGQNEPIMYYDDTWENLVISQTIGTDFSIVKNVVEVWGKTLEPAHYGDATVSGDHYQTTIADVEKYRGNMLYGFTAPSIISPPKLQINSLGAKAIVMEDGSAATIPEANVYYVVKYQADSDNFLFMGYSQPYAIVKDENPDSPFYVEGPVGEIRIVLHGGDYDNIYTNDLAKQRAEYELWQRTRLQDSVTLTLAPIYQLDVNCVVEITLENKNEPEPYIIKTINTVLSYSGIQTIQMIRYYPLYPEI